LEKSQEIMVSITQDHTTVDSALSTLPVSSIGTGACYTCHLGATTQCLRGAMGNAKNADGLLKMQCQSCHGTMSAVGSHRDGWLDEPNCQSCHHDGVRETTAVTNLLTGTLRAVVDNRFATNANTPVAGKSLYRFSSGHGGMQCSACHGSTHAIYPSSQPEDNIQSMQIQGHAGTIIGECLSCHTTMPQTANKGPHGMHSVGQSWVDSHEDIAEGNSAQCKVCHGADDRGTSLSKTMSARSFNDEEILITSTSSLKTKIDNLSLHDTHYMMYLSYLYQQGQHPLLPIYLSGITHY